jgi:hypothetical protein
MRCHIVPLTNLDRAIFSRLQGNSYSECVFTDSIYKERYERVRKESMVTRKRMEKQHEEELEKEHAQKKNIERKVSSTYTSTHRGQKGQSTLTSQKGQTSTLTGQKG